jgi:hypothetical protein
MNHLTALAATLCLGGCVTLPHPEPILEAYAAHQSQPGHGQGLEPIGDHGSIPETTYEALGAAVRIESGHAFAETSMEWVVHDTNLTGGPWVFAVRAGVMVRP